MASARLFEREGQVPEGACVWIGGRAESTEQLGRAFMEAADILADASRRERRSGAVDYLALPIIQTYRHSIELMLKAGCENTAQLIGFGRELGYGDDARPSNLESELGSTHSIARLVTLLDKLLSGIERSGASKLPAETSDMLQYLHDLDERGMAFRYATRKVGKGDKARWAPVRPEPALLDLDNAITQLGAAARMLDGGLMTYLDTYEQFLQEMWSEYQADLAD